MQDRYCYQTHCYRKPFLETHFCFSHWCMIEDQIQQAIAVEGSCGGSDTREMLELCIEARDYITSITPIG